MTANNIDLDKDLGEQAGASTEIAKYALKADLLGAYAVRASAEVGLLDLLRLRERSTEELVSDGFDSSALHAVLPYLCSVGIVAGCDGRWRLTDTATSFLTPLMLRALSLHGTGTRIDHAGQALAEALRGGGVPYATHYGRNFWSDLATRPNEQRAFHEHLERITAEIGREISPLMVQRRFRSVVDLGGGRGTLIAILSESLPEATFTVFEHPSVMQIAHENLSLGSSPRAHLHTGDLLTGDFPSADLYILCQVLHDWDDANAEIVLRNVRESMRNDDRLWVIERTTTRDDSVVFAASNLRMYTLFGARERNSDEYARLAKLVGLECVARFPFPGGFLLLEFMPA